MITFSIYLNYLTNDHYRALIYNKLKDFHILKKSKTKNTQNK